LGLLLLTLGDDLATAPRHGITEKNHGEDTWNPYLCWASLGRTWRIILEKWWRYFCANWCWGVRTVYKIMANWDSSAILGGVWPTYNHCKWEWSWILTNNDLGLNWAKWWYFEDFVNTVLVI
jgi:hypothetical protein